MGLDLVEIVLRTEETFGIDLPNEDCEQVRTVGDLYRLVMTKLTLPYIPSSAIQHPLPSFSRPRSRLNPKPWTPDEVWPTLQRLIIDQLQVNPEEVTEDARFQQDLGAD